MVARVDLDGLVEHWTLPDDERDLVAGKRGPAPEGCPPTETPSPAKPGTQPPTQALPSND